MSDLDDSVPATRLDRISTQWSGFHDPSRFVLRYGVAIRKYLVAILRDEEEAEDVLQEFLLQVVEKGFQRVDPDRGRFRGYLKTAVRNAALSRLRKKRPGADLDLSRLPAPESSRSDEDDEWLGAWRRTVLDRAWTALEAHERRTPGNLFHTALRLTADHPDETSDRLAALASAKVGRPVRADAFRKQVSRGRRFLAGALVAEVAETLENPTPERVEDELAAVGLLDLVREHLPPDWRERGVLE